MTEIKEIDMLDYIKRTYEICIVDQNCVYKMCNDFWFIILKKITKDQDDDITITNETRKMVANPMYAKFRASKLDVLYIIDIRNGITVESISNTFINTFSNTCNKFNDNIPITYIAGQRVTPNLFDLNLDVICSNGIHYLKSPDAAFYHRQMPKNYTGPWMRWYNNGNKHFVEFYTNGLRNGIATHWYEETSNKQQQGNYVDDKKNGLWIQWYSNGIKKSEGNYVDDKKNGLWIQWYTDGIKEFEENCTQ